MRRLPVTQMAQSDESAWAGCRLLWLHAQDAGCSWLHTQAAVDADDLAIDVPVLNHVLHQRSVLVGVAQARRERHGGGELALQRDEEGVGNDTPGAKNISRKAMAS
jgi:hypothetical protein